MENSELREEIRDFGVFNRTVEEKARNDNKKRLREEFKEKFPINSLSKLTKETYSLGGGKNTFCYWVAYKTEKLGNISAINANKFGLGYYKNKGGYRTIKKYGDDPETAISEIKENLVKLIHYAEKKDLTAIHEVELSPTFKGKIIYLYFPDVYINIFAESRIDYFLDVLDIQKNDKTLEEKRDILLQWKANNDVMRSEGASSWTTEQFSSFLYYTFMDKYGLIMKPDKDNGLSSDACLQKLNNGEWETPKNYMSRVINKNKPEKLLLFGSEDNAKAITCEFDVNKDKNVTTPGSLKLFNPAIGIESIESVPGLQNIKSGHWPVIISGYQYRRITDNTEPHGSEEVQFPKNSEEADRDLGNMGEEFVWKCEKKKLIELGREDLSKKVKRVGDTEHYDVISFDQSGEEKFIEVKTTVKTLDNRFYITLHEMEFLEKHREKYSLYRVYEFNKTSGQGKIKAYSGDNLNSLKFYPVMFICEPEKENKTS